MILEMEMVMEMEIELQIKRGDDVGFVGKLMFSSGHGNR